MDKVISGGVEQLMDEVSAQRASKSANEGEVQPGRTCGIEYRYLAGLLCGWDGAVHRHVQYAA